MRVRTKLPDGTIVYPKYDDAIAMINDNAVQAEIEKAEALENALVDNARNLVENKKNADSEKDNKRKFDELQAQYKQLEEKLKQYDNKGDEQ